MSDWSSIPPTKEGFYWYHYPNTDDFTIIEIVFNETNIYLPDKYVFFFGFESHKSVYELTGTFLGPIKQP